MLRPTINMMNSIMMNTMIATSQRVTNMRGKTKKKAMSLVDTINGRALIINQS